MPLTPADIHNVAFKKPPIGKRGYDEEEVDAFLDEVEREIERLAEENNALRTQVELGSGGRDARAGAGDGRLGAELQQLRAQLDRLQRERVNAEQAAQDVQRQLETARAQTRETAPDEDGKGLQVLMMAQRTADEHLNKARFEADEILSEMHAKADRVLQEAQAKAQETELRAADHHREAIADIEVKRDEAQRQVATLVHFAQDYRQRLQEHLSGLMNDMNVGGKNNRAADALPTPGRAEI